jgi:hypothetical protein
MYWLKDEIPDLLAKEKKKDKGNVAWERNDRRKKRKERMDHQEHKRVPLSTHLVLLKRS